MDYEGFVPTPTYVIRAKLQLAEIQPGETVYDLGCGDGKVLIMAAQEFDARGVGIEIRSDQVAAARSEIKRLGLTERIEIRQEDFLKADVADADVVIVYLNRASLGPLGLRLEEVLKPGTRIVTHAFDIPGWNEERSLQAVGPNGSEETLFLYRHTAATSD